jgi:hypothetical protein
MKIYLALLLFALISIVSFVSFGQNSIQGNWTGYCVVEHTNKASIAFCDLCPYEISENSTELSLNKFDVVFDNDTLKIIIDNKTTKTNYHYNKEVKTIDFKLNEKDYKFKILTVMGTSSGKMLIMKDNDDMLILLEEK